MSWSADAVATLIAEYERTRAKLLIPKIGKSERAIHLKAHRLGIKRVFHGETPRGKRILKDAA